MRKKNAAGFLIYRFRKAEGKIVFNNFSVMNGGLFFAWLMGLASSEKQSANLCNISPTRTRLYCIHILLMLQYFYTIFEPLQEFCIMAITHLANQQQVGMANEWAQDNYIFIILESVLQKSFDFFLSCCHNKIYFEVSALAFAHATCVESRRHNGDSKVP